jgi:hypothetical protein
VNLEPTDSAAGQRALHRAFAFPLRIFFVVALLLSTFGTAFGALTPGASAATLTFNVDSTTDPAIPLPGACAAAVPGQCTLRGAITEANTLAAGNTFTINLVQGATYNLTNYNASNTPEDNNATGDLDVKASIVINGNGATINGQGDKVGTDQQDRVFQVFGGYDVVFNDLTIEDGYAYQSIGGGILYDDIAADGSLALNRVTITGNSTGNVNTQGGPGGGIFIGSGRTVTVTDSTISNNGRVLNEGPFIAAVAGDGGGIYNLGTLTVSNTLFSGNVANSGGGIDNLGTAMITNSRFQKNSSAGFFFFGPTQGGGGGIANSGILTLTDSALSGNTASIGGGIFNTDYVTPNVRARAAAVPNTTVTNTTITNNNASFLGGGIANIGYSSPQSATMVVTGGTINNNFASGSSFIIQMGSQPITLTLGGRGGGAANLGTLALSGTTIDGNGASAFGTTQYSNGGGGGIFNYGVATIEKSTISSNFVSGSGSGGAISNGDGGVFFFSGQTPSSAPHIAAVETNLTLSNTTISGGSAPSGGGALYNATDSTATLTNTTIANNQSGIFNDPSQDAGPAQVRAQAATVIAQNSILAGNTDYNCSGTITNGGYNIDSAATCAFGTTGGSLSSTDPQLSPLALNTPGTTQTFALAATSPALDKVPASGANCPATDQRGITRPQGAACDIGAYELVVVPLPPVTNFTVTLSTTGNGSVDPGAGTYTYQSGSTQAFTATPATGQVFLGWTVDGTFVGFGNPLNLPVTKDRTVVAAFAPIPAFCDVTTATTNYTAITQLAARGVIFGSDNPNGSGKCFAGDQYLQRIQVAGFVARLFGWDKEDHGNTFTDKGYVDNDLWRNAGTLAFYDVARGYRDGTYDPTGNVLHAQAVSFITRAMIRKGYWEYQGDNAAYYTAVPTASGHRQDAVTFYTYAGNIPGTSAPTDTWGGDTGYDGQSTRNYFVNVLWQAYSSYFSTNHIP